MSFQQRFVWALLAILSVNMVGWWVSGFFQVDISGGPDPGLVVSSLVGLIGIIWSSGELVSAARKRSRPSKKSTTSEEDDGG